jgi:two-component system cell cycle response regulator DivK
VLTRVCGYETIEAANGKETVEMAVSEKPDLILMDVDLPDISGIDAARVFDPSLPSPAVVSLLIYGPNCEESARSESWC